MKKYWKTLLGICGTLSGVGILLCLVRAVCWEQTMVTFGGTSGTNVWTEMIQRELPLYGGTVALIVLTAWLWLNLWNAER